jgi:hypothetical protein
LEDVDGSEVDEQDGIDGVVRAEEDAEVVGDGVLIVGERFFCGVDGED